MKKWLLMSLSLFLTVIGYSQSISPDVIGTAGNRATGTNLTIDWTMGEVATATLTGSNSMVTQGFHQPYLTIVGVEIPEETLMDVRIYPNPTSNQVFVRMNLTEVGQCQLNLIALDGKILKTVQVNTPNQEVLIEMSEYPAGSYLLSLSTQHTQQIHKIQKNK